MSKYAAYVLRTCRADMTSFNGFRWPKRGRVEAPDWKPTAECGNGLHGLLWGEGDGTLLNWSDDAVWQVVGLTADELAATVDLGGKVKFPSGTVVHTGDQKSATDNITARGARGPVVGCLRAGGEASTVSGGYRSTVSGGDGSTVSGGYRSTVSGGYRSTVSGGDDSTVSGGDDSTVSGGDGSTVIGGYRSTVSGGYRSTVSGGYRSTVSGGYRSIVSGEYRSTVSGGDGSTVIGGYRSTVSGGYRSIVSGGNGSTLSVHWRDGQYVRIAVAYVGENGIKPNVAYRVNERGEWEEADSE